GQSGNTNKNKRARGAGTSVSGITNGRDRDRNEDQKPQRLSSKQPGNLTATAPSTSDPSEVQAGSTSLADSETIPEQILNGLALDKDAGTPGTGADAPNGSGAQSRPTVPKRFSSGRNGSSDMGYGPIGSPPSGNPLSSAMGMRPPFSSPLGQNHFSPGTSPTANHIQPSTSPFTQGERMQQSIFGAYSRGMPSERSEQSPIAIQRQPWRPPTLAERTENAVGSDEEDLEEFLPSSLNDLLTPEERRRRLSRSGGPRMTSAAPNDGSVGNIGLGSVGSMGMTSNHRYSRSVPAARLLDNPSIWRDNDRETGHLSTASLSFRSNGLGSEGFSPTQIQMGTSNASGAFLHGPHYTRPTAVNSNTSYLTRQILSQSYEETDVLGAVPTPAAIAARAGNRYESPYTQASSRVVQLGTDALSPSSRALQSHAPGQSLPQGIAAGFRLHLVPSAVGQQSGMKLPGSTMSMGMGMGMNAMPDGAVKANPRSPLRSQFLGNTVGSPSNSGLSSLGGDMTNISALSSSPGGVSAMRTTSWATLAQNLPSTGISPSASTRLAAVNTGSVPGAPKPSDDDTLFDFD
ncbi:17018_t:CDS:1, partial [Acaulospora colombiana]